ncbi:hypothetical protein G6F56_012984 [Rhizopus delemar]|nr:hypothetical protein G6F56_012984 [Rhizopus delemar]
MNTVKSLFLGKKVSDKHEAYKANYLSSEIEDNDDGNYDLIKFIEYSGNLGSGTGYTEAYGFEDLPPNTIKSLKLDVYGCSMPMEDYNCLVKYYQHYFDADIPYIVGQNEESLLNEECRRTVVSDKIHKFKSIDLLGQHYISSEAISARGAYIRAYFKDLTIEKNFHEMRPAEVKYFFRHEMELSNDSGGSDKFTFTFAYVTWFTEMDPSNKITTFDTINSTCFHNTFLEPSLMNILPVHCIYSPVGAYIEKFENCNIFIDFPRKIEE